MQLKRFSSEEIRILNTGKFTFNVNLQLPDGTWLFVNNIKANYSGQAIERGALRHQIKHYNKNSSSAEKID